MTLIIGHDFEFFPGLILECPISVGEVISVSSYSHLLSQVGYIVNNILLLPGAAIGEKPTDDHQTDQQNRGATITEITKYFDIFMHSAYIGNQPRG